MMVELVKDSLLAIMLVACVATPMHSRAGQQSPVYGDHPMTEGMEPRIDHTVYYSLEYNGDLKLVFLSGTIQIGIVNALNRMLAKHPETTGLVLDSEGGNIFQARGLARIIQERSLDTLVQSTCYSACAIAYVAGNRRFLVAGAELGFHAYKMESGTLSGLIDIEAQQQKDLAFYTQHIPDKGFVSRIFEQEPWDIWCPGTDELLGAGVVHEVLPDNRLNR